MNELNNKIREVLERVHDREHKYFTTSYDGVVGVQEEDIQDIQALITEQVRLAVEAERAEWHAAAARVDPLVIESRVKLAQIKDTTKEDK